MKENLIRLFFICFLLMSFPLFCQTKLHKEMIIVGPTSPGAAAVLPLILFSDSSDLKFLKNEIQNNFFLKNAFLESIKVKDTLTYQSVDSIVTTSLKKRQLLGLKEFKSLIPQINYIKYFNGNKEFDIGIYNHAISIDVIKELILFFEKSGEDKKIIRYLNRIKRETLYCYD